MSAHFSKENGRQRTDCHPHNGQDEAEERFDKLPPPLVFERSLDTVDRGNLLEVDAHAHASSRECHVGSDDDLGR